MDISVCIPCLLCRNRSFFSIVDIPEKIYRLLSVRYFFLFFLGWLWVKEGVRVNGITVLLSAISLIAIVYFEFFSKKDEPLFFSTKWKTHRWPCYFFVANGFIAMLSFVWEKIKGNHIVKIIVNKLASCSYEIFLAQMATIYLFKWSDMAFIPSMPIRYGVWLVVIWGVSIFGGFFLKKAFARFI